MGYYGEGWFWHKIFKYTFPTYPIVTKTITLNPHKGLPFAVLRTHNSTWNKVKLHNPGIKTWIKNLSRSNLILSIYGNTDEIQEICSIVEDIPLSGIELNYSCPNIAVQKYNNLPITKHKLYLKLNYKQDPYKYNLDRIERIHLNTIPKLYGGIGGALAQKYNWSFIKKYIKEGLNVAGSSWVKIEDISYLQDIGVKIFGIGSVIIVNPKLVIRLKEK